MTKAAIYARYSTDRQSESSTADQVRVCREFASDNDMSVVEVFADEGISGAALGNRPSALKIMEAALAQQFDVVIVADLNRLSRSMADLPKMIDRLVARGIRVVGVQDGYDSSRRGHKLQAGLSGIMGEAFRDMIRDRTYSALESRAREKMSTGGKCVGYRTRPINPEDPNSRKVVEIDQDQAKVVREIFDLHAHGSSCRGIASTFNKQGVPSPGSKWNRKHRRRKGWMASGVRAILMNDRYRGDVIWGKSQWIKDPDTGIRKKHKRPESEWERYHDENLRIISEDIFAASQRRFEEGTRTSAGLRRGGKAKYLLSGLLKCNECGANYILTNATSYQCSGKAGGDACTNRVGVRRDVIEEKVLGRVFENLLEPERARMMAREIERQVREHFDDLTSKSTPAEVAKIDARIERLRQRLSNGDDDFEPDEIAAALEVAEAKRQEVLDVQPAAKKSAKILVALPNLANLYRKQIKKGLGDNTREIAKARVILRDLLGPIVLCPESDGGLVARFKNGSEALSTRAIGAVGFYGSGGRI